VVVVTIYVQLSRISDGTRPVNGLMGENRTGHHGFIRKAVEDHTMPQQETRREEEPTTETHETINEMRERFESQGIDIPKPVIKLNSVKLNQHKHTRKDIHNDIQDRRKEQETVQKTNSDGSSSSSSFSLGSPSKEDQSGWLSPLLSSSLLSPLSSSSKGVPGIVEQSYQKLLHDMESKLGKLKKIENFQSCRRLSSSTPMSYSTDPYAACKDKKNGPFYLYNPLPDNERIICDTKIPPKKVVSFVKLCSEPGLGRLFPVIPDSTGIGMPPIVTRFVNGKNADPKPFKDCDIPCNEAGSFSIVTTRFIDGTPWKITMSMEGPAYYSNLQIDPNGWKNDKYWSTTSFDSEVPLPYYSKAEYEIRDREPVSFDSGIHGGLFMANNCGSKSNREQVVKDLQKLAEGSTKFRVDSVSSCLKNADIPPGSTRSNKVSIMKHYLFYFAFENQIVPDYITEKLWGPFEAGTVPVYFGAPNVKEHVPKNSIIHTADFKDTEELFHYLEKVASDKNLYESYHEWRRVAQPEFEEKLNLTYTHGTCRTCRWAYARTLGLGWNHPQQRVKDLNIPRKTCIDPWTGLLKHPVVETWKSASSLASLSSKRQSSSWQTTDLCLKGTLTQDQTMLGKVKDHPEISRVVRQVDGVIDFEIDALSKDFGEVLQLSLETKLESSRAEYRQVETGHGRLQDSKSRITILVSPTNVTITSHANMLLVEIAKELLPLRIRLISEDIDTFHRDGDIEESFFGKLMKTDFQYPVEAFFEA